MKIYSCILVGAMALGVYAKASNNTDKVVKRVKKMNKKEPVALSQKMINSLMGTNEDVLEKLKLSVNTSNSQVHRKPQLNASKSAKTPVLPHKQPSKIPAVRRRASEARPNGPQKRTSLENKAPLSMERIDLRNLKVEVLALEADDEPKSELVFSTSTNSENDKEVIVEVVEVRTDIVGEEEKKEFADLSVPCKDVKDVKKGEVAKVESISFGATELEESISKAIKNIDSYVPTEEEKVYLEKLDVEIQERQIGYEKILGKCVQTLLVETTCPETGTVSLQKLVFGLCVIKEENPLLGVYVNTFIFPFTE